jgi:hypothetical protein
MPWKIGAIRKKGRRIWRLYFRRAPIIRDLLEEPPPGVTLAMFRDGCAAASRARSDHRSTVASAEGHATRGRCAASSTQSIRRSRGEIGAPAAQAGSAGEIHVRAGIIWAFEKLSLYGSSDLTAEAPAGKLERRSLNNFNTHKDCSWHVR